MNIIKDGKPERVTFKKSCLCGCEFEFSANEMSYPDGFYQGTADIFLLGIIKCPCCGLVRIVDTYDMKKIG